MFSVEDETAGIKSFLNVLYCKLCAFLRRPIHRRDVDC